MEQILIAAADPGVQARMARGVLAPLGFESLAAWSGQEALELAQDQDLALMIICHQLPDWDGLELVEEVAKRCPGLPLVFVSKARSADVILRAFRLGARDVVTHPLKTDEVVRAVQRALCSERSSTTDFELTRQLREANVQLQDRLQELNTVYAIGRTVTSLLGLDEVLNRVVEAAVYAVDAEEGMLMLLDEETNELYLRAAKDVSEDSAHNLRLRVDDSTAGRALRENRPVRLSSDSVKLATGYLVKSLLYVPLRASEDRAIGVLGVANRSSGKPFSPRDVTVASALADYASIAIENARLFKDAERERAKLESVLRKAEEAILVLDEDHQVLLCNAAACGIWGLTASDLSRNHGRPLVEEIISDPAVKDLIPESPQGNEAIHREVTLSDQRIYQAHLTPVDGVGQVLMFQDITNLKELDRLKSEFLTSVSHDLRTPLTSILGYAELLRQVGPLNDEQERFLAGIQTSASSITDLIDDLLAIGRIEAELDLEMEPCDVREIIDQVLDRLRHYAEDKEQAVRWQRPDRLPLVRGNPRRLAQVVGNLVDNAIKYTPKGGWIAITATHDDGHVVVNVSDNGIGIPLEEQPRVFHKFYRGESADVSAVGGTGLGLAIVKAVVERHHGRVWVEAEPGVGSTFSFVLPTLEAQA